MTAREAPPQLFVEERSANGATSTLREATQDELYRAAMMRGEILAKRHAFACVEAELQRVLSRCDHKVVHDVPGYAYDVRLCYICGANLGLI